MDIMVVMEILINNNVLKIDDDHHLDIINLIGEFLFKLQI